MWLARRQSAITGESMFCTLTMPNNDAEALLRFLKAVDVARQCNDPYERSRLETALEELIEGIEKGLKPEGWQNA